MGFPLTNKICRLGFFILMISIVGFVTFGCRKDAGEKKSVAAEGEKAATGAPVPPQAEPLSKEGAAVAAKAEADEPAGTKTQAQKKDEEEGTAQAQPQAKEEPVLMNAGTPPEAAKQEQPQDPKAGTPSRNTIQQPAVDRDRLEKVFIELWCAEQAGATSEQLLELYHKFDYPPLANWHGVWNEALLDSIWAKTVLEKAKSKCWNILKEEDKKPAGGQPEAPKTPGASAGSEAAPAAAATPPPAP
jgi:hypothetical protein